ncbi:fasciclin domain-containing protein [Qipengyuania sp. JC766]|uniref:fasciclin domain-containing protein n=1 Tax=Qipengyuania sp. JC766 TaxID=3232139 RepID=UPI003459CCDE
MKPYLGSALAALTLSLAACGSADGDAYGEPVANTEQAGDSGLFATVGNIGELSTAHELLRQAGLDQTFGEDAGYTLFLPSDEAFAQLPAEDLARLETEEGRPELIAILRRHIAVGAIGKEDLDSALERGDGSIEIASVADTPIAIRTDGDDVVLGSGENAPRLTGDAEAATDGVVYVIDGLIPPQD